MRSALDDYAYFAMKAAEIPCPERLVNHSSAWSNEAAWVFAGLSQPIKRSLREMAEIPE